MKLNFILLYILLLFNTIASAQKNDFKWLMGYSFADNPYDTGWGCAIMDFDTPDGNPIFYEEKYKKIDFLGSGTNICDKFGKYLFACNGGYIEGPNDSLMDNGDDLADGSMYPDLVTAADQNVLILNRPGALNQYLLFLKVPFFFDNYGLSIGSMEYSLIDMDKNSGNGKVIERRKLMLKDTLDNASLIATKHANGRDWWVITSEDTKISYYIFLISNNDVKLYKTFNFKNNKSRGESGQTIFSHCGNYFATAAGDGLLSKNNLYFFQFDRCTGDIISFQNKQISRQVNNWIPGCAFSSDSKYLYYATLDTLYQFPIQNDSLGEQKIVGVFDGSWELTSGGFRTPNQFGNMQFSPDGRIYLHSTLPSRYIHAIHNPNNSYDLCNFKQRASFCPTIKQNLPNFPNYRLGPIDGSVCDSLGIDNIPWCHWRYNQDSLAFLNFQFTDLSAYEVEEWHWDFGDPSSPQNSSRIQHPVHRFSKPGIYEVCLIAKNKNGADTLCRTVRIAVVGNESSNEDAIQIQNWPNPFSHFFVLNVIGYNPQDMQLQLVDLTGQVVHQQKLHQGSHWIRAEHFPAGVYSLQVFERNERVFGKQVLKF